MTSIIVPIKPVGKSFLSLISFDFNSNHINLLLILYLKINSICFLFLENNSWNSLFPSMFLVTKNSLKFLPSAFSIVNPEYSFQALFKNVKFPSMSVSKITPPTLSTKFSNLVLVVSRSLTNF